VLCFIKKLGIKITDLVKACELFFAASLSYLFFGIPIEMGTIISVCMIWLSLYIYAVNPIKQPERENNNESMVEEKLELLKFENNSNAV
jgi:UDP-sugar transporter A1/2/3